MRRSVPNIRNNSFQNMLVKILSLLEIMVDENPWSFSTLSKKTLATCEVVKGLESEKKMSHFGKSVNNHQYTILSF